MPSAGTVNVNLVAQTTAFHAGMQKAESALHSFHSTIESGRHLVEAYLGYEAIAHIAEWVHHTMEAVEHQTRMATALGITSQAMTTLSYSATLVGSSAEQLASGMMKMEANLSGVGGETGKTKAALEAMGLSMRDLQGKSGDQQLAMISDAMRNVASSSDRAKIGIDIFGKGYLQMAPMLALGSERLREQAKEAESLGLVFSDIDAVKIEAANESLKKAGEAIQGGLVQATKELSPLIEGVVNYFLDLIKQSGGFGKIASGAMAFVVQGIGIAADALNVLKMGWYAIESAVSAVTIGIIELVEDGVKNFLTFGQILGNFGIALSDTATSIGDEFALSWAEIKSGVASMTQFAGKEFAALLDVIANGLRAYSDTAADAVMTAAGKVRAATGTMVKDSQAATTAARVEADNAMKMASNSWKSMFQTSGIDDNPLVKMLDNARLSATHFGEQAAGNFLTSFDKVASRDGSKTWNAFYADLTKASEQHAEEEAARKQREMDEARAESVAEIALDRVSADRLKQTLDERIINEDESFAKRMANLKKFHDEALLSDAEFKKAEEDAQKRHQEILAGITVDAEVKVKKWEQMNTDEKVAFTANSLNNLATLMQSHNRKAFELGKAAAYASTIITTASAAMKAYDAMSGIPYIGPALGAAAALAAIAAGAIQLQTISSAHFDGGGGVSGAGFSGSATAGASGTSFGPNPSTPGVTTGNQVPTVHVNVQGLDDDSMHSGLWIRKLLDSINEAQTNGSPVNAVGSV